MQVAKFAERLRQLQTKGGTPVFAKVFTIEEALSDERYSHRIMQSDIPCAFAWKEQDCPDSVFGLDCFFAPDYHGDFSAIEEGLHDLLDIRVKRYSVTHPQHGTYMKFSLPVAILKGSEAWVQRRMEEVLILEREWKNCQASQIIRDILSHFAEATSTQVQFERIWKDIPTDYFRTHWDITYEMLNRLAQVTGSTMKCNTLTDGTISVSFRKAE